VYASTQYAGIRFALPMPYSSVAESSACSNPTRSACEKTYGSRSKPEPLRQTIRSSCAFITRFRLQTQLGKTDAIEVARLLDDKHENPTRCGGRFFSVTIFNRSACRIIGARRNLVVGWKKYRWDFGEGTDRERTRF